MNVTQTFEWRCDECHKIERIRHSIHAGAHAYIPTPPQDWKVYGDLTFCDEHEIEVTVTPKVKKNDNA